MGYVKVLWLWVKVMAEAKVREFFEEKENDGRMYAGWL